MVYWVNIKHSDTIQVLLENSEGFQIDPNYPPEIQCCHVDIISKMKMVVELKRPWYFLSDIPKCSSSIAYPVNTHRNAGNFPLVINLILYLVPLNY